MIVAFVHIRRRAKRRTLCGLDVECAGDVITYGHERATCPTCLRLVGAKAEARRKQRARTLSVQSIGRELRRERLAGEPPIAESFERPRYRAQCRETARPCSFVGCQHHLYLDVDPVTGSIKLNFPDLEPWELQVSCVLDVAERGEADFEEIGTLINLTPERARQVAMRALVTMQANHPDNVLRDVLPNALPNALPKEIP